MDAVIASVLSKVPLFVKRPINALSYLQNARITTTTVVTVSVMLDLVGVLTRINVLEFLCAASLTIIAEIV